MKLLGIILLAVLTVTVAAKHRKEAGWKLVDSRRLELEVPVAFFKSDVPACIKGAGFYRDPQNCHQYIRCVDKFGTGRHFSVYTGRCEPGLVFDENISACNWPDLAAPCSNGPEKLKDSRKPYKPEQIPEDNAISAENAQNKPYPAQQQQVVIEQENSDVYGAQQQEVQAIEEIQISAQEPIYQEKIEQTFIEEQTPEEPFGGQVQEQVQVEKAEVPQVQEQVFQKPEYQQQNIENVQALEESTQKEQNVETEQQQIIHQQENKNDRIDGGSRPEQGSSDGFQQVAEPVSQQFEIPQQAQQDELSQQQSQSEWWVADENPQHNPPEIAEQIPSNVNEEPFLCSDEGFYRHPDNCSQFIRCVKIGNGAYAVHFFECPKQLVFDEKDSSCIVADNHSCRSNVRKKRQASNTNLQCKGEGFFRHPEDCRAFYRCVKSATGSYDTHTFSCPANLVFDEEYTTCNWPEKAPPCDTRQQFYQPTRKPVKAVQTEKPKSQYKPPSRSTNRGSDRWSTAKPQNDYMDKSITQETYSRRRTTERPRSTTNSYENGARCRSPGFFPNDNDCTKFYKCVKKGNSFIRYDLACPQNFAYDDRSKRCVAQRYVSSCSRNKPPYPPRQDDEETTTSPSATTARSSGSQTSDDGIKCEKEGYFRHPQDCNKFYRCVDFNGNGEEFVRYDFNCPEGLVFDEANSVCNWPDQSAPCDTRGGGGGQEPGEDGGSDGSDTVEGGPGENEGEDSRETSTSSTAGEPSTEAEESTSAAPSDENERGSENESEGSESGGSGSENECTKEGYYRNPDDCNKFYRCVDFNGDGKEFVRYDFNCPEGLVFDEKNSVCNWPAESEPCDTKSGGGNQDGNEGDGKDTTTSSSPERGGESSEDSSQSEQTTPSDTGSSSSSPGSESSSSAPGTDDSQSSTQSSNEDSRKSSGECTEEGFFRDPEDCNKFYRCVDQNENGQFVKYDFTCPEGLVFDEANSVCNWPDQSAPCDGGSPGKGESSTSGPGDNRSESTSKSSSEETSEGTTASTTSSTTEGSQSTSGEDSSSSTTERSTSESEGTSSSPERGSGGNQGECTEEGFFRNPEDCTKFYRCVDQNGDGKQYVKYDFVCPDGLVFDEVNSVCNWPDQSAPCDGKADTGENKTTDSDSSSSSTEDSMQSSTTKAPTRESTESSTSEKSPCGDSTECKEPGFYRCKEDCTKFYRCVEEEDKLVRYDFTCPDGLIFDDKNKKCDWPSSELSCDEDSSATTASETSSSASTTKECTEEGFFRDPDDCRKYYRCIDEGDGTFSREDYSCGENEVFDEEMRYCNRKDLAPPPCGDSETTSSQSQTTSSTGTTSSDTRSSTTEKSTTAAQSSTESSTQAGSSSECSEPGFHRCPEDCTKFYRCVEEEGSDKLVRYDFQCPDGLIFDETKDKCDWPSSELTCDTESTTSSSTSASSTSESQTSGTTSSSSTSSSDNKSAEGCTEEGFFRNPDDCSKYYRCLDEGDGTLIREDFACAEDEVFDEEMRYCNRKDLAPPCDGSSSTTESSRSSTTQSSSSQQESESTTSSSGTTSRAAESGSGECTEEGFHRDPNDCSKFYRCVDFEGNGQSFTRYDFECPEGLVFDESNDVCNWPSSVPSCESGDQSEKSTESSSSTDGSRSTESSSSSTESSAATSESSDSSTSSTTPAEQTDSTTRGGDSATGNGESTSESSSSSTTSSESDTTSGGSTSSGDNKSSDNIECTEEGFFRHPDDCRRFYRCVDFAGTGESFVRYDFECGEGTVFDDVNNVCNWPEQSPSCESKSSSNKESGDNKSSENNSTTSESSSESSNGSSGDSSTTPQDQTTRSSASTSSSSSDDFQCEEEGYFKHPSDCKKYYECKRDEDTGELVKIDCECPEGQVWDNEGWYCNAEELSPPCESGDSTRKSSFKCEEEGFFRDPEDCSRYYQCNKTGPGENDFTSERYQCDDGLVFDEEGRYCNAPELSKPCDESSSTDDGTRGGESSKGTTSSDQSSTSSDQSATSSGQGECTKEGFFRNPDDCTKYYQCSQNEETGEFDRTDYSCPDGRIFDEGSNYCNEPEFSDEPCDSNGNGQSTTAGQASSESSTSGTRRSGGNPECTQEGFFRHPDDCAKFYRCVDFSGSGESFTRYDFDCPEGTHFDEVNSVCNWPSMTPPCESNNRRIFRWNSDVDIRPQ